MADSTEVILSAVNRVDDKITRLSSDVARVGERVASLETGQKNIWQTIDKEVRPRLKKSSSDALKNPLAESGIHGKVSLPSSVPPFKVMLYIAAAIGAAIAGFLGGKVV